MAEMRKRFTDHNTINDGPVAQCVKLTGHWGVSAQFLPRVQGESGDQRMLTISVCIGSSCHLKGAYQIIEELRRYIQVHDLADRVELKANFCAGQCQHAVSVSVDGKPCVQVETDGLPLFLAELLEGRF